MAKSTKRKSARASAPEGAGAIPENGNPQAPDLINDPPFSTLPDLDLPEADPSQVGANGRPLAGETRPGEPTKKEIYDAALNVPSKEYFVDFKGEHYPIVELTMMKSLVYLDTFGPQLEEAVKATIESLRPVYEMLLRSYTVLLNLRGNAVRDLWEIARQDDIKELEAFLLRIGAEQPSDENLMALQKAAQSGDSVGYVISLIIIFGRPFANPALAALKDLSLSAMVTKLGASLTTLVLASLVSSRKRESKPVDENALREQLDLMDLPDQFNVVWLQLQLYKERGKLARFFGQIGSLVMRNMNSGTPSASTTSTIPS
jgi:hypothetical protein